MGSHRYVLADYLGDRDQLLYAHLIRFLTTRSSSERARALYVTHPVGTVLARAWIDAWLLFGAFARDEDQRGLHLLAPFLHLRPPGTLARIRAVHAMSERPLQWLFGQSIAVLGLPISWHLYRWHAPNGTERPALIVTAHGSLNAQVSWKEGEAAFLKGKRGAAEAEALQLVADLLLREPDSAVLEFCTILYRKMHETLGQAEGSGMIAGSEYGQEDVAQQLSYRLGRQVHIYRERPIRLGAGKTRFHLYQPRRARTGADSRAVKQEETVIEMRDHELCLLPGRQLVDYLCAKFRAALPGDKVAQYDPPHATRP